MRLWDPRAGTSLGVLAAAGRGSAMGIVFSPDGRQLAVGHADGTIVIWEMASRQLVGELGRSRPFGAGSCGDLGHVPVGEEGRAELERACQMQPAAYFEYIEARTGLGVAGSELVAADSAAAQAEPNQR